MDRTRYPLIVALLVAALATLIGVAAATTVDATEQRLADDAAAALAESSIALDVVVRGRDVYLRGVATNPDHVRDAEELLSALDGVRTVHIDGVSLQRAPQVSPQLTISFDGAVLTLQGTVPHGPETEALVTGAQKRFGIEAVVDELTRADGLTNPAWFARVSSVFELLVGWDRGRIDISEIGLHISGIAKTEEAAGSLARRLAEDLQFDVTYQLGVVAVGTPSLEIAVSEDRVVMTGSLDTAEAVTSIVTHLAALRPDFTNTVSVASVEPAGWLNVVEDLLVELQPWTSWGLRIDGDDGEVWGFAPDSATLASLRDDVISRSGWDDSRLEVTSEGLATEISDLIARTVSFRNGNAQLDSGSRAVLDDVAAILATHPSSSFFVEGYTDDRGRSFDNLQLSHQRAEAVVTYLVARGVDRARLEAVGYGESRPVASNDTAEGREWNRRIEFSPRAEE